MHCLVCYCFGTSVSVCVCEHTRMSTHTLVCVCVMSKRMSETLSWVGHFRLQPVMGGTFQTTARHGWDISNYSLISGFRSLTECNKHGAGMHFECNFSPSRIQTLILSHPCCLLISEKIPVRGLLTFSASLFCLLKLHLLLNVGI